MVRFWPNRSNAPGHTSYRSSMFARHSSASAAGAAGAAGAMMKSAVLFSAAAFGPAFVPLHDLAVTADTD